MSVRGDDILGVSMAPTTDWSPRHRRPPLLDEATLKLKLRRYLPERLELRTNVVEHHGHGVVMPPSRVIRRLSGDGREPHGPTYSCVASGCQQASSAQASGGATIQQAASAKARAVPLVFLPSTSP